MEGGGNKLTDGSYTVRLNTPCSQLHAKRGRDPFSTAGDLEMKLEDPDLKFHDVKLCIAPVIYKCVCVCMLRKRQLDSARVI